MPAIAYLGPQKTNTHFAAQAKFGSRYAYVHAPTVEEVFRLVEREKVEFGVVPIENSLEGAVTHTLDRFIDFKYSPVTIHGEIVQPIQHYLIAHQKTPWKKIRIVFSHPQALGQCNRWLAEHYPDAARRETSSTAEAVAYLLSKEKSITRTFHQRAAIGRRELALDHELKTMPIPITRENRTRFLILGLGNPCPGKRNKTSLMFALKDKPGALYDALLPFKQGKINLTKIESRPSKQKAWEYIFFIDLEGHITESRVERALKVLERRTSSFQLLGSYPRPVTR